MIQLSVQLINLRTYVKKKFIKQGRIDIAKYMKWFREPVITT